MLRSALCRVRAAAALLAVLALAACAGAAETPPAPTAAPPTSQAPAPASVQPAAPTADAPTPTTDTTGLPDVPYQMAGFEILAARVGTATYSGYKCVVSPDGCACELPLLQDTTFTFTAQGPLLYTYQERDSEVAGTWSLTRAAPNQWEYIRPIASEESGGQIGEARALLSFTEEGYSVVQLFDFDEVGPVVCPEVAYQRLAGE